MLLGVSARHAARGRIINLRPLVAHHSAYSTSSIKTVPLAYDLHEPPKPMTDDPNRTSPIVFMHGLFGSKKNNRSISKALARDLGRSIYAVDLRNHGDSPHDPRHDYTAMAQDVRAFIQEHKLDQPTLIGHSMGAKTALTLALASPTAIKDLIAVDNAPVDAILSTDFAKYVRAMQRIDASDVTSQRAADAILAEAEPSLPVRQFLLANLHTPASGGVAVKKFRVPLDVLGTALSHMGDFPFKEPERVRYERPALFVRGTRSKYVPDEVLPVVGQFFPRFEVVDIDSGHWVISEKPEEFRQAVVRFLSPKE
ncbi:unnamed protein product [Discula destructiva]